MRLFQSSQLSSSRRGNALDNYLGNMAEALVRARAERDIRNARVAAEAAIRMRSSFLENMNHELRTPLNAIIGFAGMLQQAQEFALSEEQRTSYSEYILQSADLLLGHINTILEIAALDNGSVEPIHQPVDVYSLIDDAVQRASVRARAGAIRIVSAHQNDAKRTGEPPTPIAPVWADDERIGQAMDHILQTAMKSCAKGGRILVRAVPVRENWIDIQVRDDGEGFTDKEIADALSAFGNVQRGLERPFSGPGVGISIAKTFVEMQGGDFAILSRKNKGTLITMTLPFATAEQISGLDLNPLTGQSQQSTQSIDHPAEVALAKSA